MNSVNPLLSRQSNPCISCPSSPPCDCAQNQQCFQYERTCDACSYFKCVGQPTGSAVPGPPISPGTLAGAVIGSLLFLALAVFLLLWYRKRLVAKAIEQKARAIQEKVDTPVSAAEVLRRPDTTEKPITPTERGHSTIDIDPLSQQGSAATTPPLTLTRTSSRTNNTFTNPFDDNNSIQTTGTDGTNVIPIALVPPVSFRSQADLPPYSSPTRPARSPDVNLNLEHVNVSRDSLRATSPISQTSGTTQASGRQSYMSAASYASDFLHEAPMIITPTKGAFRQVLGVVKAEVINTQGSALPTASTTESLKPPRVLRPSTTSPLATASFGPSDLGSDSLFGQSLSTTDPFGDEHSARPSSAAISPTTTNDAFGSASDSNRYSAGSDWTPEGPKLPWAQSGEYSRPSSMSTQAGSIIDIGSATRVNVGLSSAYASPPLTGGFPQSPYRTTVGRLVSPPTTNTTPGLEQQQQMALAHAQARAQAQGLDTKRRVSGSSVLSAASASTRAYSILESFPFVPPSPISNRPMRSPPCSPLSQQTFGGNNKQPPKESVRPQPPKDDIPTPPSRLTLGLSTASQLSTSSTGLGSFSFQIDAGSSEVASPAPPPAVFKTRQRASLDTLALTSDLSSYPLTFDQDMRDSFPASDKN